MHPVLFLDSFNQDLLLSPTVKEMFKRHLQNLQTLLSASVLPQYLFKDDYLRLTHEHALSYCAEERNPPAALHIIAGFMLLDKINILWRGRV